MFVGSPFFGVSKGSGGRVVVDLGWVRVLTLAG
jgi:hypothetical protein